MNEASAFELLSLPVRLTLDDEELRDAFREAGRTAHPDAGGGQSRFEALREARDLLASPSGRLRHWLALRGVVADSRGAIDPGLMDLFGVVGQASQRAADCARRRAAAKSALGLALLEAETQACVEVVEEAVRLVGAAIDAEVGKFPMMECGALEDVGEIARVLRNLTFLEKWHLTLRGLLPQLL